MRIRQPLGHEWRRCRDARALSNLFWFELLGGRLEQPVCGENFSIVQHYGWKDQTKKLVRRAFKFAGLRVDMNADPFAVIIRCTCERKLDRKTVSKWSRALQYVAR